MCLKGVFSLLRSLRKFFCSKVILFFLVISLTLNSFIPPVNAEPISTVVGGTMLAIEVVGAVASGIMAICKVSEAYDSYSERKAMEKQIAENQSLQKEIRERAAVQSNGAVSFNERDMSYISSMIRNEFMKNNALQYGAVVQGDITQHQLDVLSKFNSACVEGACKDKVIFKSETINMYRDWSYSGTVDWVSCSDLLRQREGMFSGTFVSLSLLNEGHVGTVQDSMTLNSGFYIGPNGNAVFVQGGYSYPSGSASAFSFDLLQAGAKHEYRISNTFVNTALKNGLLTKEFFEGCKGSEFIVEFNNNTISKDVKNTVIGQRIGDCQAIDCPTVFIPSSDGKSYSADKETSKVINTNIPIVNDNTSEKDVDKEAGDTFGWGIISFLKAIWRKLCDIFTSIFDWFGSFFDKLAQLLKDIVDYVWEFIKKLLIPDNFDIAKYKNLNIFGQFSFFGDMIQAIKDMINSVPDTAPVFVFPIRNIDGSYKDYVVDFNRIFDNLPGALEVVRVVNSGGIIFVFVLWVKRRLEDLSDTI